MSTTGNNTMTNRALRCAYNSGDEMHVQKSYDPYREFPYSKKKKKFSGKEKERAIEILSLNAQNVSGSYQSKNVIMCPPS